MCAAQIRRRACFLVSRIGKVPELRLDEMQANGVTQQYHALAGQIPAVPFMKSSTLDINSYVVGKALDGLFYMLGQQRKSGQIRRLERRVC